MVLVALGQSGAAGIGRAGKAGDPTGRIPLDGQSVGQSKPGGGAHLVPESGETVPDGLWDGPLYGQEVGFDETDAGDREGGFDVHPEIDEVHEHLRDGLTDGVSAGSPHGDHREPVPEDDDRHVAGELVPPREGVVQFGVQESPMKAGRAIYVAPDIVHGYQNTGNEILRFVCVVPHPKD